MVHVEQCFSPTVCCGLWLMKLAWWFIGKRWSQFPLLYPVVFRGREAAGENPGVKGAEALAGRWTCCGPQSSSLCCGLTSGLRRPAGGKCCSEGPVSGCWPRPLDAQVPNPASSLSFHLSHPSGQGTTIASGCQTGLFRGLWAEAESDLTF